MCWFSNVQEKEVHSVFLHDYADELITDGGTDCKEARLCIKGSRQGREGCILRGFSVWPLLPPTVRLRFRDRDRPQGLQDEVGFSSLSAGWPCGPGEFDVCVCVCVFVFFFFNTSIQWLLSYVMATPTQRSFCFRSSVALRPQKP